MVDLSSSIFVNVYQAGYFLLVFALTKHRSDGPVPSTTQDGSDPDTLQRDHQLEQVTWQGRIGIAFEPWRNFSVF